MLTEDIIIIGGGPCGLSAAIALKDQGFSPLVIEKGNIVNAIYKYPTHQTFFSTSEKLEIGGVPFVIEERKPRRNQALSYYREVVKRKNLRVHSFETVNRVKKSEDERFKIETDKAEYSAAFVVMATGYYDSPNYMGIPGEERDKVFHYFKEAHPFFDKEVVVIGGKNSAVDATLELEKVGAHVTVLYRGDDYSPSVKPWILPEFQSLVNHEKIKMEFEAEIKEIREKSVVYEVDGKAHTIANDFVFAMTGYHPDHTFLTGAGVAIEEESGKPIFDSETMETNVEGIFIAGVIAAGNNANKIFIENGRFHGECIAKELAKRTSGKPIA